MLPPTNTRIPRKPTKALTTLILSTQKCCKSNIAPNAWHIFLSMWFAITCFARWLLCLLAQTHFTSHQLNEWSVRRRMGGVGSLEKDVFLCFYLQWVLKARVHHCECVCKRSINGNVKWVNYIRKMMWNVTCKQ